MAVFQGTFHSFALSKRTNVDVLLPTDAEPWMRRDNEHYNRPMKTLYLLHGYSDCSKDWLLKTDIAQIADRYNLAVVMPNGDNSFYLDRPATGYAYCRFVGEELPDFMERTFGLSRKKEDVFIGGASMGGFGAEHTALMYPEQFCKALLFSPAVLIDQLAEITEDGEGTGIANYAYYLTTFGDLSRAKGSDADPAYLIKKLKQEGKDWIPFYLTVGRDDFLIQNVHRLRDFLTEEHYPFVYQEEDGNHDWYYWNRHLEEAIRWMLDCGEQK
ncbi:MULTISPECIES: alpha/beta hydrolase [Caproicibacterium]|uniref:Alpha/beta hydrolase family protein n=1 Tax=Caproicibacterium argilliputei TaxID=3030016 RepID=A0AA97H211_9FIRM|nr:alpha/beta hydrolase family protein [Caproicibacterium argilliputei]WOC31832.1 alpha/beta hydrolase family protein [Caproicibacterium argilliputei]